MIIHVVVPEILEDQGETTISSWLIGVGKRVKKGDSLVVIENDKVTMEIEAPASGTLQTIQAQEGRVVTGGEIIGWIDDGKSDSELAAAQISTTPKQRENQPVAQSPKPHLPALRLNMQNHLGRVDLKVICFDLGINHELFPHAITDFIVELLIYLERQNRVDDLLALLRGSRPDVDW